jgi:acetyl esterase
VNLRSTIEGAGLRALVNLPAPAQRALSGGATVVDGQTLAPDLGLMLRVQNLLRPDNDDAPIEDVRAAMSRDSAIAGGTQPIGATCEVTVAGRPARHYLPTSPLVPYGEPGPLLVFIHGGGWIEGDIDTHDAPCRLLAELSGVPVVSVTYRLAPEDQFPTAHDDAYAAFLDIRERAAELGADPHRLAVGGDSAGGNMAASIAISAAQDGVPLAFQLLIYPMTDGDHVGDSYGLFNQGFYLTKEFMDRAEESYTPEKEQLFDPRMSVIGADLPAGLAPAYVCTAGFDPLRDEGEAYAKRLANAGHLVELERFADQIHGFVNMLVVPSSRAAAGAGAARRRSALS